MSGTVFISAITMTGLSLLFATLLGFAHTKLKVEEDPKVERVEEALPGIDCGACGYPGCHQCAVNITKGNASPDSCVPGGDEVAEKVAEIMGMEIGSEPGKKRIAVVHCGATEEFKKVTGSYEGVESCRAIELTTGGDIKCEYGCLGYGDCEEACPFDAIHVKDGLPEVDPDKCTGCGVCVETCPRDIITVEEINLDGQFVAVACNSPDDGVTIRQKCEVGCVACGLCEKLGPEGTFEVDNNLSHVHYDEIDGKADFETAIDKCPVDCIVELPKPSTEE